MLAVSVIVSSGLDFCVSLSDPPCLGDSSLRRRPKQGDPCSQAGKSPRPAAHAFMVRDTTSTRSLHTPLVGGVRKTLPPQSELKLWSKKSWPFETLLLGLEELSQPRPREALVFRVRVCEERCSPWLSGLPPISPVAYCAAEEEQHIPCPHREMADWSSNIGCPDRVGQRITRLM